MLSNRYWSSSKALGSESSMPTSVISKPELRASTSWPDDVAHPDLVAYFCLGLGDIRWLRSHRNPVTRLAQGLRLTGLPYLGFRSQTGGGSPCGGPLRRRPGRGVRSRAGRVRNGCGTYTKGTRGDSYQLPRVVGLRTRGMETAS